MQCRALLILSLIAAAPAALAGDVEFKSLNDDPRVLLAPLGGDVSARTAAADVIAALKPHFDAPPRIVGAVIDRSDRDVHAAFSALRGGEPMHGVLLFSTRPGGHAAAIWDRSANFNTSFPELLKTVLNKLAPAGPPPAAKLTQHNFPDGTGQIMLPADWRVTGAVNGAVDASNNDGAAVALGIALPILTPEAAAAWPGGEVSMIVAPFGDPVEVMPAVFTAVDKWSARIAENGGQPANNRVDNVRVVEAQKIEWANSQFYYPQGRTALILWDADLIATPGAIPVPYRNLSVVYTAPIDGSQWYFYHSTAYSPAAKFAQNYETLVAIWSSWKVSDATLQKRLNDAARTLREVAKIYQDTNANTQKVYDNTNAAWSHVIRGDWPVEDVRTGDRTNVPSDTIQKLVDQLNEVDGPDNWRVVPLNELNP